MIMKKILALTLALLLLLGLAACGGTEPEAKPTENNTPAPTSGSETPVTDPENPPEIQTEEGYSFTLQGIKLVPGAVFDESKMPENYGKFEVPSCAIEGSDILYNYEVVEVTVFDAGEEPVIYSIYLLDANTSTDEGLYLGDDVATVESIYGTDYKEDGTAMVYEKGNTQLRILIDNGAVFNIEYRMVTV